MERADKDLAYMLQYENIAWFEDGQVRILDRRVYPAKVSFVVCSCYEEVARAIADMVTQSAGPYTAAAMGMALAAYTCRDKAAAAQLSYLERAAEVLSTARPTTRARMRLITDACLQVAKEALAAGAVVHDDIAAHAVAMNNARYGKIEKMASYLVDLFPARGKILTQCFGETIVGQMLKLARRRGLDIKVYCAETRPYFQGGPADGHRSAGAGV